MQSLVGDKECFLYRFGCFIHAVGVLVCNDDGFAQSYALEGCSVIRDLDNAWIAGCIFYCGISIGRFGSIGNCLVEQYDRFLCFPRFRPVERRFGFDSVCYKVYGVSVSCFIPNEDFGTSGVGIVYVGRTVGDLDIFYRSVFLASYGVDIGGGDGEHSVGRLEVDFVASVRIFEVESLS